MIDTNANTVWMYLHDLSVPCVIGDTPICSLVRLISLDDFKEQYQRGETPPLVLEHSTNRALIPDISNHQIDVMWLQDGRSVVALVDDEPFAMIVAGKKKGFSKAISLQGPWGNPWNDEIFNEVFGKQGSSQGFGG